MYTLNVWLAWYMNYISNLQEKTKLPKKNWRTHRTALLSFIDADSKSKPSLSCIMIVNISTKLTVELSTKMSKRYKEQN